MTVVLEGYEEAKLWLEGIEHRLMEPGLVLAGEFAVLEAEERAVFDRLQGRYVDTGRTERSLTEPAGPDAIREITPVGITFGTSVPYAPYLTKVEEGGQHKGGNAVLVDMAEERLAGADERVIARMIGE